MTFKLDEGVGRLAGAALALFFSAVGCGEVAVDPDARNIDGATADGGGDGTDSGPSHYTLTVSLDGSGTGAVTSNPAGISCGDDCVEEFPTGTEVTLTATPTGEATFGGWSGACSGTGACVVAMDDAKSVTAAFNPPGYYSLSVSPIGGGQGTVTSNPAGIDCGDDCTEQYIGGTVVTLSASASEGSTFDGWAGAECSGTGTCGVTVTAATTITATFTLRQYNLTVSKSGTGTGTVTSSPAGINCGGDCSQPYDYGSVVTLSASAASGSTFSGWSGGGCGGTGSCVVTVTAATAVTATFARDQYNLTVSKNGAGAGTVTSNPPGINCGGDCTEPYDFNTVVSLTASTGSDSWFSGWSGDCSGTGPCSVTMNAARSVTATFEEANPTYNYAFVSSAGQTGALGGLAGADALCAAWALDAGIGGTYRAILSTVGTNANSRLGGARGWIRPDGRPVGDLPADIFGPNAPLAPLRINPNGGDVGDVGVWSASNNLGVYQSTAGGTDCGTWNSASNTLTAWYGFSNTTAQWLNRGSPYSCNNLFHIYCFQVDHTSPLNVAAFAESGRRIFVSTGDFVPSAGMAGADALCAADVASTPELAGATFYAFLADVGTSAASRFTSTAEPIVRMDGLRVANSFAALTSQDLIHPPSMRADGAYETWRVFAGAQTPTEAGSAATTCSGWSDSSTSGLNAVEAFPYSTSLDGADREWFGGTTGACASHRIPVYCLESN